MQKHFLCVLVIGLAMQASSNAAVRAEWSGNASGETTREVSADVNADNGAVASEDMQSESSKAVAAPQVNNNNIINVETGSQAKSASNADADARNANRIRSDMNNDSRVQPEVAYRGSHTEVEYIERDHHDAYKSVSVAPMLGTTFWRGAWKMDVSNDYTFGLLLDIPVTSIFSIETEGAYGSYQMRYSDAPRYGHHFDQWTGGLNGKLYLSRAAFRPYIGLGMDAVYYQGMNYGPLAPNGFAGRSYNQWIGVGQVMTGADVRITESLSLGARLSYSQPLINRPVVTTNGPFAAPGCEEAGDSDTGYYRAMGTVKVSF